MYVRREHWWIRLPSILHFIELVHRPGPCAAHGTFILSRFILRDRWSVDQISRLGPVRIVPYHGGNLEISSAATDGRTNTLHGRLRHGRYDFTTNQLLRSPYVSNKQPRLGSVVQAGIRTWQRRAVLSVFCRSRDRISGWKLGSDWARAQLALSSSSPCLPGPWWGNKWICGSFIYLKILK